MYKKHLIEKAQSVIRDYGCDPVKCPRCGNDTKFSEEKDYMNCESRQKSGEMICNLCGSDELVLFCKDWAVK